MIGRLTQGLRRRMKAHSALGRVVKDSAWLFSEQVVKLGAGFVVGVLMARQIGPEQYGLLNYVLAVVGMVGAVASLGLNPVVLRELARAPEEADVLLGAAFFLKASAAAVGWLACVGLAWSGPGAGILLPLCALSFFFQAWDVLELWFQARGQARVCAQMRMGVSVLVIGFRIILILIEAPLFAFVLAGVLEIAVCAAGCFWMAERRGLRPRDWSGERRRMGMLLRESWPILAGGVAIQIQAQGDQIILASMLGEAQLGQYSAALRVVAVFGVVPVVLQTVVAPGIMRLWHGDPSAYRRRLHDLYRVMTGLFLAVTIPLALFGPAAVRWAFGESYAAAGALLPLLSLRLFFANFGVARGVFLSAEGMFRFGLLTSVAGAVASVGLSFWLIPRFGVTGVVFASFGAFGVTTFALDVFHPKARANLRSMVAAMLRPWRSLD